MTAADWPFSSHTFRAPWWLSSGHIQTLAAAFWPEKRLKYQAIPHRVVLEDGDIVVVHDDCPPQWQPGDGAVLLVHGLGGSHLSPLLARLANKFHEREIRTFRLDLRGCGAGAELAKHPYHAGRSDDVATVVNSMIRWCQTTPHVELESETARGFSGTAPASPLIVLGASLGGNIVLKYLGEYPESLPSQLVGGIAINPPIDLARSVRALDRTLNRLYDRHFVGSLGQHLNKHLRRFPDAIPPVSAVRPNRMYQFDDWYTAPMSGFASGAAYYERCSSAQFLPSIRVPTKIITAANDPLVPVKMFEEHQSHLPPHVQLTITEGGGHLGYFARRDRDPDGYWLDWRVLELVTTRFQQCRSPMRASYPGFAGRLEAGCSCRSA